MDLVRAAVDDVELLAVAAGVQPVGADAAGDEADLREAVGIDHMDAVGAHVGDIKALAIGRDADVLRHALVNRAQLGLARLPDPARRALRCRCRLVAGGGHAQLQVAHHLAAAELDLGQRASKFAGEDGVFAVARKVGVVDAGAARHVDRILRRHGLGVAKIQPQPRLGNDDGRRAIGREIQVVGVVHRHRLAGFAGARVDRRHAAVAAAFGVVGHPQGAQIPGRHDVLRADADLEFIDHLERGRVDHVDIVGAQVGHVDPLQIALDDLGQLAGGGAAVDVGGLGRRGVGRQRGIADPSRHALGGRGLRHHDPGARRYGHDADSPAQHVPPQTTALATPHRLHFPVKTAHCRRAWGRA